MRPASPPDVVMGSWGFNCPASAGLFVWAERPNRGARGAPAPRHQRRGPAACRGAWFGEGIGRRQNAPRAAAVPGTDRRVTLLSRTSIGHFDEVPSPALAGRAFCSFDPIRGARDARPIWHDLHVSAAAAGADQSSLCRNMDEGKIGRHAEAGDLDHAGMSAALDAIDADARNAPGLHFGDRRQPSSVGLAGQRANPSRPI
jgi:hypothetical protein